MPATTSGARYLKRLRPLNAVATVLHAIQGVLILILANDFAVPLTTILPGPGAMPGVPVPQYQVETTIEVAPLIAAFFFLSAIAHALIISPWVYPKYLANVKQGINWYRWVEYSLSASIMIVVIGLICGITGRADPAGPVCAERGDDLVRLDDGTAQSGHGPYPVARVHLWEPGRDRAVGDYRLVLFTAAPGFRRFPTSCRGSW